MKRIIRCKGHSLLNTEHVNEKVAWADVWISWVDGQRGKRHYFGPTLISIYDLRGELHIERELAREYPKDRSFAKSVREYEDVLRRLQGGERVIVGKGNKELPEIYTSEEGIDRAEAELMLTTFLKTKGVDEPVFRWVETEIVVQGITLGHVAENETV